MRSDDAELDRLTFCISGSSTSVVEELPAPVSLNELISALATLVEIDLTHFFSISRTAGV